MFANIMQHFVHNILWRHMHNWLNCTSCEFSIWKISFLNGTAQKASWDLVNKGEKNIGKIRQIDNCWAFYQYLFYGCAALLHLLIYSIQHFGSHLFILRTAANQILLTHSELSVGCRDFSHRKCFAIFAIFGVLPGEGGLFNIILVFYRTMSF